MFMLIIATNLATTTIHLVSANQKTSDSTKKDSVYNAEKTGKFCWNLGALCLRGFQFSRFLLILDFFLSNMGPS
jgi:hypothetical protein